MKAYKVTDRREVPTHSYGVTMVTKKVVATTNTHGGEKYVLIELLESGYSASGFGNTWELAEKNAVNSAMELEAA